MEIRKSEHAGQSLGYRNAAKNAQSPWSDTAAGSLIREYKCSGAFPGQIPLISRIRRYTWAAPLSRPIFRLSLHSLTAGSHGSRALTRSLSVTEIVAPADRPMDFPRAIVQDSIFYAARKRIFSARLKNLDV